MTKILLNVVLNTIILTLTHCWNIYLLFLFLKQWWL